MTAPTFLDDDDLGIPARSPRSAPDYLPPLQPAVIEPDAGNPPASSRAQYPLEQPPAGNPPARTAPRPRATRAPHPPLRVDILALLLAAVVCVCVTVLALQGVTIPEVLQTIGYVSAGGAFGLATAGNMGRRP